jgi:hypothetical protein
LTYLKESESGKHIMQSFVNFFSVKLGNARPGWVISQLHGVDYQINGVTSASSQSSEAGNIV